MDLVDLADVGPMVALPPGQTRLGDQATLTYYVGPNPGAGVPDQEVGGSQAFRVDLTACFEIGVHYHLVDQFQVVVAGSGWLGRHSLLPGAVHYADAYGPIRPGPEGLAYLTLRGCADVGAWWMPESRADLAAALSDRPRRNVSVDALSDGTVVAVDDDDGLRVVGYLLEPGEEVRIEGTSGSCRYGIVLDGSVTLDAAGSVGVDVLLGGAPDTAYVVRSEAGATYLEVDLPRRPAPGA